jgi:hypothetical protein
VEELQQSVVALQADVRHLHQLQTQNTADKEALVEELESAANRHQKLVQALEQERAARVSLTAQLREANKAPQPNPVLAEDMDRMRRQTLTELSQSLQQVMDGHLHSFHKQAPAGQLQAPQEVASKRPAQAAATAAAELQKDLAANDTAPEWDLGEEQLKERFGLHEATVRDPNFAFGLVDAAALSQEELTSRVECLGDAFNRSCLFTNLFMDKNSFFTLHLSGSKEAIWKTQADYAVNRVGHGGKGGVLPVPAPLATPPPHAHLLSLSVFLCLCCAGFCPCPSAPGAAPPFAIQ